MTNNRGSNWIVHVKGQGKGEIKVKLMERLFGSLLDISGKPISGKAYFTM